MQRYFAPVEAASHEAYTIQDQDDVHHIKNVMRQNIDDLLIINFKNDSFICKIINIQANQIDVECIERLTLNTELPINVTIASGMLKNDKYEWMIQKATELGCHAFIPFIADRSIVKLDAKKAGKKVERFEKIVKEAAEQSYRQVVPKVNFVENSKQLARLLPDYDYVLIAYEESAKANEVSTLKHTLSEIKAGQSLLVIFGPEGGISDSELELFNAKCAGLGPRILRAETAPLYLLSSISYHLDLN